MPFAYKIYSKVYKHIALKGIRKRNYKKFSRENKKLFLNKFSKDEKLIYAFFLDIAQKARKNNFLFADQKMISKLEKSYNKIAI